MDLSSLGQIGLFISSFLAATFFPIGCETIFLALLVGVSDISDRTFHFTIINATVGNTLGAITTYFLGMYLPIERALKMLKIKPSRFLAVSNFVSRRSTMMALLAWLPILGDPIALALGNVKANLLKVAPMMAVGKYARFFVLGILGIYFKDLFFS